MKKLQFLIFIGSFKTGYFQGKEFLQLSELKTWLTALSKTQTQVIFIADSNNFHDRIEPHEEMFLLNLEQNKVEAAM